MLYVRCINKSILLGRGFKMKLHSFRIFVSIGLLIVSFMICVSTARAHWGGGYQYTDYAVAHNPDWMGHRVYTTGDQQDTIYLSDDLHISELSIPGTHDTYSKIGHSWSAHCQMMSLSAQLESGIRVLDIRLNVEDERLRTAHGSEVFYSYFEDVLAECIVFLGNHEKETILMHVAKNAGDLATFVSLFKTKYMEKIYEESTTYYERWFWHQEESENPTNPTLGEVRGKIVLLQAFPAGSLYGLNYLAAECCDCTSGSTNCDSDSTIKIQNSWKMSTNWSLSNWKARAVVDHLNRAATGDPETIYINYLSGSYGCFPYFVASGHSSPGTNDPHLWMGWCFGKCGPLMWTRSFLECCYFMGTNEVAYRHLVANRDRAGIVMADFPGPGLIKALIEINYERFGNWPPFAASGCTYEASEGTPIVFDASDSSDPEDDPLQFRWDFDDDGVWDTEWSDNPTATFTWYDNACTHDPAMYPAIHPDTVGIAVLQVTDGAHTSGDAAVVIIFNVAPTVMIDEGDLTPCILPGQPVSFNALISDPGCLDTHTATWSFSDGTVLPGIVTEAIECPDTTGIISVIHSFEDLGLYSVVVEVQDADRGSDMDTTFVQVITALEAIDCVTDYIQDLPDACMKKPAAQRKNTLTGKLTVVRNSVSGNSLKGAIEKLRHDIRAKADGSIDGNSNNDWIICEEAQRKLCMTFDGLIGHLQSELNGGDSHEAGAKTAKIKSFEAEITESGIELSWNVISDAEIRSFKIERRLAENRLNGKLDAVNLISSGEQLYIDGDINSGQSYLYTLIAIGNDNSELASESISVKTKAPDIVLHQNLPNPFNLTTQIEFEIPGDSYVEIHIYNILGKQLKTLVSERLAAGRKVVTWDGTDDRGVPVASGVYFYRLNTDIYAEAKKMLLLK